jgi:N-acetylmuramoyl-L-alanine amidase CwlA
VEERWRIVEVQIDVVIKNAGRGSSNHQGPTGNQSFTWPSPPSADSRPFREESCGGIGRR